jgi:hypothetical protein
MSKQTAATQPLKELHPVDWDEFFEVHVAQHQPVVLRGGAAHWPAIHRWTTGYLRHAVAGRTVVVKSKSDYGGAGSKRHTETVEEIDFAGAIDMTVMPDPPDMSYVRQTVTLGELAPLVGDVSDFHPRLGISVGDGHLWIGPKGTLAQMHWEPHCNLNAQIRGEKRWIMVSPEESHLTYPNQFSLAELIELLGDDPDYAELMVTLRAVVKLHLPVEELIRSHLCSRAQQFIYSYLAGVNNCNVDAEAPDAQRTPLFARALRYETVLEPGDLIYSPCCWRHAVRSLSPSVSANWFFHPDTLPAEVITRALTEHLANPEKSPARSDASDTVR